MYRQEQDARVIEIRDETAIEDARRDGNKVAERYESNTILYNSRPIREQAKQSFALVERVAPSLQLSSAPSLRDSKS